MLTVLAGLYPTVLLLTLLLSPHTQRFGLPVSLLIGNACSVVFLEFVGMPALTWLLGPWLKSDKASTSAAGLLLIGGFLAMTTVVFSNLV